MSNVMGASRSSRSCFCANGMLLALILLLANVMGTSRTSWPGLGADRMVLMADIVSAP